MISTVVFFSHQSKMIIILYITLDCGPTHYRVTIEEIRNLEDVSEFSVNIGRRCMVNSMYPTMHREQQ